MPSRPRSNSGGDTPDGPSGSGPHPHRGGPSGGGGVRSNEAAALATAHQGRAGESTAGSPPNTSDLTTDSPNVEPADRDVHQTSNESSYIVLTSSRDPGGMDGCSDAAYQGVLHIREEAEKERAKGSADNHHFNVSDDVLANYLDGYAVRTDGAPLQGGGVGWHDSALGVTVIRRGEFSMTMFRESPAKFATRKAD